MRALFYTEEVAEGLSSRVIFNPFEIRAENFCTDEVTLYSDLMLGW